MNPTSLDGKVDDWLKSNNPDNQKVAVTLLSSVFIVGMDMYKEAHANLKPFNMYLLYEQTGCSVNGMMREVEDFVCVSLSNFCREATAKLLAALFHKDPNVNLEKMDIIIDAALKRASEKHKMPKDKIVNVLMRIAIQGGNWRKYAKEDSDGD